MVTTCDQEMLAPEELELNNEEDPRQVYQLPSLRCQHYGQDCFHI